MLHILMIIIFVFICPLEARAQNRFFDDKVSFFGIGNVSSVNNPTDCPGCSENIVDEEQGDPIFSSLNSSFKQNTGSISTNDINIKLFIDTECRFSSASLEYIKQLKRQNPSWIFSVYVMGPFSSFNEFALDHKDVLKADIALTWDMQNRDSNKYDVSDCPAYVIEYKNKVYKTSGQPDIEEIVRKL